MANYFDQFDEQAETVEPINYFNQFDEPEEPLVAEPLAVEPETTLGTLPPQEVVQPEVDESTPWGLAKKGYYQSQAGASIQDAARIAQEAEIVKQQGAPISPVQLKYPEQDETQLKIDELRGSGLLQKMKRPADNLIDHTIKKYGDNLSRPGMTAGMISKIALEDKDVALDVADSVLNKYADEAIDNMKKAHAIPESKAMETMMKAEDFSGAFGLFMDNPVDITIDAMASSAYPMAEVIATGAAGAPAGPAGFVLGTFKGSFDTNYKSKFMEIMNSQGAKLDTREGIKKALADKKLIRKANQDAFNYSLPIAIFDAASGGIASKTLASTPLKSSLAQTAVQTGLGGGGEALGQISETGEITSPAEVLIEGLMEAPGGIIEPAIIGKKKLFGKKDAPDVSDQGGGPPELFTPTHKTEGGKDAQVVTKDGKVVPDTYIDAEGNVFRDSNAMPISDNAGDISLDVNATVGAVKAEIKSKQRGIVGEQIGPMPAVEPMAEAPAITPTVEEAADRVAAGAVEPVREVEPKEKPAVEETAEETIDRITSKSAAAQKQWSQENPPGAEAPTQDAFMSEEEKTELHKAKQALPAAGQEQAEAKERIVKRLEKRQKAKVDVGDEVTAAAEEAATSPTNDLPEPTEAQKESGSYKKGHTRVQGLEIAIENPAGSKRRPEWPTLKQHYGYIKGTVGADSEPGAAPHEVEQIDVFVNPDKDIARESPIFIIDQSTEDGSTFDEHKIMMGFDSEQAAREAYLANYTKDWNGLKQITQATQEEFKTWLDEGDTTVEYAATLEPVTSGTGVVKDEFMRLRERGAKRWAKVLPGLPRKKYEELATEAPGFDPRTANKSELQIVRKRIQKSGASASGALRGVWEPKVTDAPRRLQPAAKSEVVVPSVPLEPPRRTGKKPVSESDEKARDKTEQAKLETTLEDVKRGTTKPTDKEPVVTTSKEKKKEIEKTTEPKVETLPTPDVAARAEPIQDPYTVMIGKDISYQVEVEETGETYTVTVDAGAAMAELDTRVDALNKLKGCI